MRYLRFLLGFFLGLDLIKSNRTKLNLLTRKLFLYKKTIQDSNEGYAHISPLPSKKELNEYYSSKFWTIHGEKVSNINIRDISHYLFLKEKLNHFLKRKITILNFGAGHGGISHLFWLDGHNVINVEPSKIPDFYSSRWTSFKSIDLVNSGEIDLIYSSHSLEHLEEITHYKKEFKRVLNKEGYVFIEVPNGINVIGNKLSKINPPHTFYFREDFFLNWFKTKIFIDTLKFEETDLENHRRLIKQDGEIIRALGKI